MKNSSNPKIPGSSSTLPDILANACGPVAIPMTNDYLFRAFLQRNNKALKGLIGSLLRLSPDEIISARITNPIELGASITDKEFILDIKLILNNNTIVNLEMQVLNEHNWTERSLSYLCRAFDNLNSGEKYTDVKPVIQIGILDYTLFPEYPEFYSTYQFLNVKNYTKYSDKLRISVLNLDCIHLASQEDKDFQTDSWAALFKSATWEEIKMLAQKNDYIKEASSTIYQLTQEEKIRQQCEAREDYYRAQRDLTRLLEEQKTIIAEQKSTIAEKDSVLAKQKSAIAEKDSVLAKQKSILAEQKSAIAEKDSTIAALKAELETFRNMNSAQNP